MAATVPLVSRSDWESLEASLNGSLLLPGAGAYETARLPARPQPSEHRPAGIVVAADAADVAAAIAFARAYGVPMASRSGGHCYAGRSSTSGLLIDVTPIDRITVADGTVTVGAGTRLGRLYDELEPAGLTLPMGTCPTVGVAGHALAGGLGFLGRAHGLACDRLVAAEVVLADGQVVWCDENRESDLFWALRGAGGGQFGVVTTLVFETVRLPTATSAFHLTWPYEHAAAVIDAWEAWAPQAPDELVAELRLVVPSDPSEGPQVSLFGTMLDSDTATTAALLGGVIDVVDAEPTWEFHEQGPYVPAVRRLNLLGSDQEDGAVPMTFGKSEFFRRALPAATVSALAERLVADRLPGYDREVTFFAWGGAYNRVPVTATAFVHREERFMLACAAVVHHSAERTRSEARAWLDEMWRITHPWGAAGVYPNFPDPTLEDGEAAYHGANLPRLRAIKRRYDPDNRFRFHQSLNPD